MINERNSSLEKKRYSISAKLIYYLNQVEKRKAFFHQNMPDIH